MPRSFVLSNSRPRTGLKGMAGVAFVILAGLGAGCASETADDMDSSTDLIREDVKREPVVVRVPVRYTRNAKEDVGTLFSSSWVPFTSLSSEPLDGFTYGYTDLEKAKKIAESLQADKPGAGYVTTWFRVEIPWDTDGAHAYSLARVKIERDFELVETASSITRAYSPIRIRSGSDQPCISVTSAGSLDGKMKQVPLPFTDEGFTERDWKVGDKDDSGVPIKKVIVGSLAFTAYCWPENVEGKTRVSSGGAAPIGAFVMFDKSEGQGSSDRAVVHVNLVENEKGEVSVGGTFSTNAGVLGEREVGQFNEAVTRANAKFTSEMQQGADARAKGAPPIKP